MYLYLWSPPVPAQNGVVNLLGKRKRRENGSLNEITVSDTELALYVNRRLRKRGFVAREYIDGPHTYKS